MNPLSPCVAELLGQIECSRSRHPAVGDRWLVAVSGGPDSMALLRAADQFQRIQGGHVTCGHVDHQLRQESGADARWVQQQCEQLGIQCLVEQVELPGESGQRTGIEEQARNARYAALTRMACEIDATAVLTGHTADDNAETILHHLLRGTGLRGLSGIPETRSLREDLLLWRPLLNVRRSTIVAALQECGQASLTDSSNASDVFTRNRIRNELLPWLEREMNPRAVDALLRIANQATEQQSWIEAEAEQLLDRVLIEPTTEATRLDRLNLAAAHPVLRRECFVRLWIRRGWPRQAMTAEHWQRLADFCRDDSSPAIQMPGARNIRRRGAMIVIESFE